MTVPQADAGIPIRDGRAMAAGPFVRQAQDEGFSARVATAARRR
jgi:hypothetical protein